MLLMTIIIYLNHNTFECLNHNDATQFDDKIAKLKTRSFWFDLFNKNRMEMSFIVYL